MNKTSPYLLIGNIHDNQSKLIYGLLDHSGSWVVVPQYDKITPLVNFVGFHVIVNDFMGILDSLGQWMISPRYECLIQTCELRYFAALVQGKWGLLNEKEEWVIDPILQDIPFWVKKYEASQVEGEFLFCSNQQEYFGFQNSKGNWAIEPTFSYVNRLGFDNFGMCIAQVQGKFGFIDFQGHWIIPPRFNAVFTDNMLQIDFGFDALGYCTAQVGDRWGYINRSGEWVISPQFDSVLPFGSFNLAIVTQNDRVGVINTECQWVIAPEFKSINEIESIGFVTELLSGQEGLLSPTGEWIVSPVMDPDSIIFWSGPAVLTAAYQGQYGILSLQGDWLVQPTFAGLDMPSPDLPTGGMPILHQDSCACLVSLTGEVLFQSEPHERIEFCTSGAYRVTQGNVYGYINGQGQWFAQPQFFSEYYPTTK